MNNETLPQQCLKPAEAHPLWVYWVHCVNAGCHPVKLELLLQPETGHRVQAGLNAGQPNRKHQAIGLEQLQWAYLD